MNRILLATNACSFFFKGDRDVRLAVVGAEVIWVPIFALGELHTGFRAGARFEQNLRMLNNFLAEPGVRVLEVTANTAEIYGRIRADLKRAGTPLPVNDVWSAAQAMEHGAVVISYDRHFLKVPGLRVWPRLEFGT